MSWIPPETEAQEWAYAKGHIDDVKALRGKGTIEEIIPRLVTLYHRYHGVTAETINDGDCWVFADDLKIIFPEGECQNNVDFEGKEPWFHAFFLYNGLYYDSETPEGTTDWRNLPCCVRCSEEEQIRV